MQAIWMLLAGCLALDGCGDDNPCANHVVSRAASPGGAHEAVLFQRDCGATTGFSTQISILAQGREPTDGGNAFIADGDHGLAEAGGWGGPWTSMRWQTPDRLEIVYAARSRIIRREAEVAGVKISYRPSTP